MSNIVINQGHNSCCGLPPEQCTCNQPTRPPLAANGGTIDWRGEQERRNAQQVSKGLAKANVALTDAVFLPQPTPVRNHQEGEELVPVTVTNNASQGGKLSQDERQLLRDFLRPKVQGISVDLLNDDQLLAAVETEKNKPKPAKPAVPPRRVVGNARRVQGQQTKNPPLKSVQQIDWAGEMAERQMRGRR